MATEGKNTAGESAAERDTPTKEAIDRSEDARAYRRFVLERVPRRFEEDVERWVVEGFEDGLVRINAEGLPVAVLPDDERELLRAEHPFGWHESAEGSRVIRRLNRVDKLRTLLELGQAQRAALRASGIELVELGMLETMAAWRLAGLLALARTGWVPPAAAARLSPLLADEVKRDAALDAPTLPAWAIALRLLFATPLWLDVLQKRPVWYPAAETYPSPAGQVLQLLEAGTSDLPSCFKGPNAGHLEKANKLLRHVRVTGTRPDLQPKGDRTGPMLSPWGAARRFADCFERLGIEPPLSEV